MSTSTKHLPPFERVIELHGPAVLRFCAAQAGSERAEDCFQETMLAALRAYDTVRDPSAVRSWLFSIAQRKSVDAHRARAREPEPVADPEPAAAARPGRLRRRRGLRGGHLAPRRRAAGQAARGRRAALPRGSLARRDRRGHGDEHRGRAPERVRGPHAVARATRAGLSRARPQKRRAALAKRCAVSCSWARASPRRARSRSSRRPATKAASGDPWGPISSSRSSATTVS